MRLFATTFLVLLGAFAARADTTVLLARSDGAWLPVSAVNHSVPLVTKHGRLVEASGGGYRLVKVTNYWKTVPAPAIVDVHDIDSRRAAMHMNSTGTMEHDVQVISGSVRSPVSLRDVYVVFDFSLPSGGEALMVREIGRLRAHRDTSFEFAVPPNRMSGLASAFVHVYSDGFELLQTRLGAKAIRRDIERRIQAHLAGVKNAGPIPYFTLPPARPASMRDDSPVRQVDVIATIAPDGSVSAAHAVKGATQDYAVAAERAASDYFFIPKVVNGKPCTCRVDIAVQFDPKLDRGHG